MRMRQRDIDALRIGIAKQEREAVLEEQSKISFDRIMARERVTEVELRRAADIRAGDRVLAIDSPPRGYYVYATVRSNTKSVTDEGERCSLDRWIALDHAEGGSGGSAVLDDDVILIERKAA